ncbi:MAG: hypothetical protein JXB49_29820 [Bacteroidales bacterium]|nr:hypothetical protein [Bacteroidales bacterium]
MLFNFYGYRTEIVLLVNRQRINGIAKAGMKYDPKEWNCSDLFIDGHCNPFSERYEYMVNASGFIIRAKVTFDPGQIRMNMVLE